MGVFGGVGNQMSVVSTLLKNIISDKISCYVVWYYLSQIIFSDNIFSWGDHRPVGHYKSVNTDDKIRSGQVTEVLAMSLNYGGF